MRKQLWACIILAIFAGCQKEEETHSSEWLLPLVNTQILPAQEGFAQAAARLSSTAHQFAQQPDSQNWTAAKQAWKETQLAWNRCEIFNWGEIADRYLHARVANWPTDITELDSWVASADTLSSNSLSTKGSHLVGLHAAEYLLFGPDTLQAFHLLTNDSLASRRRILLDLLAQDIDLRAAQMNYVWQPSGEDFGRFWAKSSGTGISDPMNQVVNAMAGAAEDWLHKKVGDPLGKYEFGQIKPEWVEGFYAGTSRQSLVVCLDAWKGCFGGETGSAQLAIPTERSGFRPGGVPLVDLIQIHLANLQMKLAANPQDFAQTLQQSPQEMEQYYEYLRNWIVLLKVDWASALNITLTLSDNDGD